VQDHIWELVLAHLDWNGEGQALYIGCGNGALTIKLAQKYTKARVIGLIIGEKSGSTQRILVKGTQRLRGKVSV